MTSDANIVTLADKDGEQRRAALGVTPQAEDLNNLAVTLKRDRFYHAACVAMRRAVALCPDSGFLWNGLGSVLWNIGRYEEAYAALRRSLQLIGDEPGVMMNMGMLLSSLGRKDEALDYLRRTVERLPDDKHARWSYALGLLDHGHWGQGFREYDCRIEYRGPQFYPPMPYPKWNGESLDGKVLYVQAEQGVGDRLLFSRYLAWICDTWPTCKIKALMSSHDQVNLESILHGFTEVYPIEFLHHGIPWPKADYGCFLMSIAAIHGTTTEKVPADPGLIRARCMKEKDAVNLPEPLVPAIKVGVCWSGNPVMDRNHERSIPAELMLELEADPLVQLYSLQFGDDGLRRLNAGGLICDVASEVGARGLLGTACAMLNLDLVITCCTANAHLAGVLGVPAWVLLCYDPYWTWLRGRDDSVWYDSVRLFRQRAPGDWRELIDRVKHELNIHARLKLERATTRRDNDGQCIG